MPGGCPSCSAENAPSNVAPIYSRMQSIKPGKLSGDGLLREWPRPDAGIERHESYALQWYSLAALAVILAAVLSFRRTG